MPMEILPHLQPVTVFDAATLAAGLTSRVFAFPTIFAYVNWQIIFGSAPGSVDVKLETSIDQVAWNIYDSFTTVGGGFGVLVTSDAWIFIRVRVDAAVGGSTITVKLALRKVSQ